MDNMNQPLSREIRTVYTLNWHLFSNTLYLETLTQGSRLQSLLSMQRDLACKLLFNRLEPTCEIDKDARFVFISVLIRTQMQISRIYIEYR